MARLHACLQSRRLHQCKLVTSCCPQPGTPHTLVTSVKQQKRMKTARCTSAPTPCFQSHLRCLAGMQLLSVAAGRAWRRCVRCVRRGSASRAWWFARLASEAARCALPPPCCWLAVCGGMMPCHHSCGRAGSQPQSAAASASWPSCVATPSTVSRSAWSPVAASNRDHTQAAPRKTNMPPCCSAWSLRGGVHGCQRRITSLRSSMPAGRAMRARNEKAV